MVRKTNVFSYKTKAPHKQTHTKNQILISKWSGEIQYKTRKLNWQVCPTHQWVSKEQSGLGRSLWKKDCGEEEERNPIAKDKNFHITEEHRQSCMRTAAKNGVEMRRFLSLQTPHTGNKGEQEHTLLEYRTSWDSRLQHTGKPSFAQLFVQLCRSSRKSNRNGVNWNHFFLSNDDKMH